MPSKRIRFRDQRGSIWLFTASISLGFLLAIPTAHAATVENFNALSPGAIDSDFDTPPGSITRGFIDHTGDYPDATWQFMSSVPSAVGESLNTSDVYNADFYARVDLRDISNTPDHAAAILMNAGTAAGYLLVLDRSTSPGPTLRLVKTEFPNIQTTLDSFTLSAPLPSPDPQRRLILRRRGNFIDGTLSDLKGPLSGDISVSALDRTAPHGAVVPGVAAIHGSSGTMDVRFDDFHSAAIDSDLDGDDVPDTIDTCVDTPNFRQRDTDEDGVGNACDCDFNQDGFVLSDDLLKIIWNFYTPSVLHDLLGDGFVQGDDWAVCFFSYGYPPG